jgi:hypothetical protein
MTIPAAQKEKPARNQVGVQHHATLYGLGIWPDELLPLRALHERLGWGAKTLELARRKGLRVLAFSKYRYVLGTDLIRFIEEQPPAAPYKPLTADQIAQRHERRTKKPGKDSTPTGQKGTSQ